MTKEQAQYLLEALTFFELYPGTTEYSGKPRESIFSQIKVLSGYEGKTDEEILKDEALRKFLGEVAREETEIPEKTDDSQTVPQELETLIEKSERREEELKAAREKAKTQTKEEIERIKKAVEESRKRKVINLEPPQVIPSVELSEKEKNDLEKMINRAKSNPRVFSEETIKTINKSLKSAPEDISKVFTPETVEVVGITFTDKLLEIGNRLDEAKKQGQTLDKIAVPNPIWLFASVANPNDEGLEKIIPDNRERIDFAKKMQEIAIALESDYVISKELLVPVFGEKIIEAVLGSPDPVRYQVSPEKEDDETISIGVNDIYDLYKTFSESPTFQAIFGGAKKVRDENLIQLLRTSTPWLTKPRGFIGRFLTSTFFRFGITPGIGTIVGYKTGAVASYLAAQGVPLLTGVAKIPLLPAISVAPTKIKIFFNVSIGKASIKIGSFSTLGWKGKMAALKFGEKALGLIAGKSGQSAAVGIVTKKGFQVFTSQVFSKIGAALGSVAPIIGTIIGAIVGWLIGKVLPKIIDWIKRNKEVVLGTVGAIVGFALGGIPGLIAGGAIALAAAMIFTMGAKAATAQIGGTIQTGLIGITSLVLPTIGVPIIIALISVPVIVAIILFIINSGAYIVPPKLGISGAIESPYIGVEKEIVKVLDKDNREINIETEEISNDRLPIKVSYKVNVKAKKGTLTNITFENSCRVTKDGPPPTCTAPTPSETPDFISPVEDFVFEYEKDYETPGYQDSFVVDIFTVTADAPEQKGAVAATSAVVKIGEPPEECPAEQWPIDSGYITQGAYTPSGYSHENLEAIDIGANLRPTFAGHSGIVTKAEHSSCLGNYIEIQSICEGKSFVSQYAHLEGLGVKTGQEVIMGQTIGLSGNTGSRNCTTGPHLHYRFKYVPSGNPSFPDNPPYMMRQYIPKNVPRGCTNSGSCGVSI